MQAAFLIRRLRYRFRATKSIQFGEAGAANSIRGKLGWNLRRVASGDVYSRLFEPTRGASGPSGFADWPRPFVLRASHLDGRRVEAGEEFQFDLHLFETGERAAEAEAAIRAAFAEMARAEISGVDAHDIEIDLAAPGSGIARIGVEFITPMELKSGGALVERPEFGVLFARTRDRVATLRSLYGGGAIAVDFAGLGERSERVAMESGEFQRTERTRRSSRTGQTHGLGGFTGEAIYSGNLDEFWPWLDAAQWTGVGRQTVWGKGQIQLTRL